MHLVGFVLGTIKNYTVSGFYAIKELLTVVIIFILDTSVVQKLTGSSIEMKNKLASQFDRVSLESVGYSVIYSPISLSKYIYRNTAQLAKNIHHYYATFYKRGKSLKLLFPAYEDVQINNSIKLLVTGYTTAQISHLSAFKLTVTFLIKWLFSLLVASSVGVILFTLRDIPVNKFLFISISVGFFIYLLLSGFVFFLKKYKYSKYTTAMHRY